MSTITIKEVSYFVNYALANTAYAISSIASSAFSTLPASARAKLESGGAVMAQQLHEHAKPAQYGALIVAAPLVLLFALITWPLVFPSALVTLLCGLSCWLFSAQELSVINLIVMTVFVIGSQLVMVLPVYFAAPFLCTGLAFAAAIYSVYHHQYSYAILASLWVLTSPYHMFLHFCSFPFIFATSIFVQLLVASIAIGALYLMPERVQLLVDNYEKSKQHQQGRKTASSSARDHHHVGTAHKPSEQPLHKKKEIKHDTDGEPLQDHDNSIKRERLSAVPTTDEHVHFQAEQKETVHSF